MNIQVLYIKKLGALYLSDCKVTFILFVFFFFFFFFFFFCFVFLQDIGIEKHDSCSVLLFF